MSDKEKDVMDFLENLPQKSTKKSSSKVSLNKKKLLQQRKIMQMCWTF